ncbi:O-antigen ligase [Pseudomonas citronellolis]|uniref:O-antigen ligase n=1 Tax=Pseudomonas citronellolis TaxID=53408 RepID=A0AAQ1HJV9_9PSED|nr:O-antigen ligase domain-containing protein [Pseudomonas citronellolis]SFC16317.1 O-antigen ligase [Pseudomonas citronellolis]
MDLAFQGAGLARQQVSRVSVLVVLFYLLYLASIDLINYLPFTSVQLLLLAVSLSWARVECSRRSQIAAFGLPLLSFSFCVVPLLVEGQTLYSWRLLHFALVHGSWVGVLGWREGRSLFLSPVQLFRLAVCVFLLWLILGNSGSFDEYHHSVFFLEISIVLLGLMVFRGTGPLPRLILPWVVVVAVLMALSDHLAAIDGAPAVNDQRLFEVLGHLAFAICLCRWFGEDSSAVDWVVATIVLMVFLCLGAIASLWLRLDNPSAYNWFGSPPLFNHIRHVAYFLCVAIVLCIWAMLRYRGLARGLVWLTYVVAMGLLLWSGGRGAFIACLVGGTGVLWLGRKFCSGRVIAWMLIGFLLALLLAALFPVDFPGLGWMAALARSESAESLNRLSSSRLLIWSELWTHVLERPWFGWGGGAVRRLLPDWPIVQAHNGPLQVAVEWGGLGVLVIGGGMLFGLLKHLPGPIAAAHSCDARLLGAALVISLFVLSLVDGVLFHAFPQVMLAMSYALLACRRSEQSR